MQKTAYDMRIIDWSSDVCSSDLVDGHAHGLPAGALHQRRQVAVHVVEVRQVEEGGALEQLRPATGVGCVVAQHPRADRIGPLRGPALAARVLAVAAPACEQLHVRRRLRAPCEQLPDVGRVERESVWTGKSVSAGGARGARLILTKT